MTIMLGLSAEDHGFDTLLIRSKSKSMKLIKNPIYRHIKSNNSGTAKVKIVKKERDHPLFTSKQLIKF
jgi:hypothetical protein